METTNTEYPVCPHCGHVNKQSQWMEVLATGGHSLLAGCVSCKENYRIKASVSEIVFTTTKD